MATAVADIRTRTSVLTEFHQPPGRTGSTVSQSLGSIMSVYAAALRACIEAYRKQYVVSLEVVRREKKAGIPQDNGRRLTDEQRATIDRLWAETGYNDSQRASDVADRAVDRAERQLLKLQDHSPMMAFARLCALWRNSSEFTDRDDRKFIAGAIIDLAKVLGLPDPTVWPKHRNPETSWRARLTALAEAVEAIAAADTSSVH